MYTLQSIGLSVCTLAVCLPVLPFFYLPFYFLMPCSPVSLPGQIQFVSLSVLVGHLKSFGLSTYFLPPCYRPVCRSLRQVAYPPVRFPDSLHRPACFSFCVASISACPVPLSVGLFAFPPETCMPTFLSAGRPARRHACLSKEHCSLCLSEGRSACQSAEGSACLCGPSCPSYLTYMLVDLPATLLVRACLPAGIQAYLSACLQ